MFNYIKIANELNSKKYKELLKEYNDNFKNLIEQIKNVNIQEQNKLDNFIYKNLIDSHYIKISPTIMEEFEEEFKNNVYSLLVNIKSKEDSKKLQNIFEEYFRNVNSIVSESLDLLNNLLSLKSNLKNRFESNIINILKNFIFEYLSFLKIELTQENIDEIKGRLLFIYLDYDKTFEVVFERLLEKEFIVEVGKDGYDNFNYFREEFHNIMKEISEVIKTKEDRITINPDNIITKFLDYIINKIY